MPFRGRQLEIPDYLLAAPPSSPERTASAGSKITIDSIGNNGKFGFMQANTPNLEAIGDSLLEHAQAAEFTAQRGVIESLFPYVVQASKRMSARSISRFLEEQHQVKVSYVTIGKALRQPARYWYLYFDSVENAAWVVAKTHGRHLKEFISEPEKYQEMLDTKPVFQVDKIRKRADLERALHLAQAEYEAAVKLLDDKWFHFDESILEEARSHLLKRLQNEPAPSNADEKNH